MPLSPTPKYHQFRSIHARAIHRASLRPPFSHTTGDISTIFVAAGRLINAYLPSCRRTIFAHAIHACDPLTWKAITRLTTETDEHSRSMPRTLQAGPNNNTTAHAKSSNLVLLLWSTRHEHILPAPVSSIPFQIHIHIQSPTAMPQQILTVGWQ